MSLSETDISLFLFINKNLQNSFFDAIMPFITKNGELIFLPFILWAFLKERGRAWIPFIIALFSVALADGSGHILKDIFARQRPCDTIENINLLVGCGRSFSMPSNHATNAFGFAMVFWFMRRDIISYLLMLVAAVIGFSRVYVGVHYPFDVVAGAMIGIAASYMSVRLYRLSSALYEKKAYGRILYIIILLISLFRIYFVLTGPFDLSPDEAHYWEWSRHPDWSYYSKGPMIAYLIYAGTAIFGDNVFGVRILAVGMSALSSLILYRLGRGLYDEKTGFASALLIQIVPLYSVYGILMTIDSPFIFFWILSLWLFYRAINYQLPEGTDKSFNYYWVMLGISAGLGLLTKYTMAFFYLSAFLYLIIEQRRKRTSELLRFCASALISMIIFSPVVFWNNAKGWITLKHTAGQAHLADGLMISARSFFEFVGSQFAVITPVLIILLFISLWRLRKDKEGAFLFWFSAPVIVFFILKSLQGKVQANWPLAGYATGFIAFSAYYLRDTGFKNDISGRALKILVSASILLTLAVNLLPYSPLINKLPQEKDPTTRLAGWKELGGEISRVYNEMSSLGDVFIFSDSYQVSSELAFYVKGNPVTYCVNLGRRMNQYDLWPGFEGLTGYNAVFVRTKEKGMPEDLARSFGRHDREVITIRTKNNKIMKFTVFKCYDFKGIKIKPPETF